MTNPADPAGGTALRFALRWRMHELGNARRLLRSRPLQDRAAVLLGLPLLGCYGLACLATGLAGDRAALAAHPLRSVLALAALDLVLVALPVRLHARHLATRLERSWVRVLPLDAATTGRIAAMDRALVFGPAVFVLLLIEALLGWWSGLNHTLPGGVPAAIGACLAGLGAAALPLPRIADELRTGPERTRSSPFAIPPGFDAVPPRHLPRWQAMSCLRGRPLLLVLPLFVAGSLLAATIRATDAAAVLPAAGLLLGQLGFIGCFRAAPLASTALRSLPLSHPRLLATLAAFPLTASLLVAAPPVFAATLSGSLLPRGAVQGVGILVALDLAYAVCSAHLRGRETIARFGYGLLLLLCTWEWPKFGLSILLLPIAVLGLLLHRDLRALPLRRRSPR